jgi:uncharacterized delta-60 repeat protein
LRPYNRAVIREAGPRVLVRFGTASATPPKHAFAPPALILGLLALMVATALPKAAQAAPGQPDPSFGSAGKAVVDFGNNDAGEGVAVQQDGKVVVVGNTKPSPINYDFAATRLLTSGTLDPSFGTGGRADLDLGSDDTGSGMVLQPDGRILIVGTSSSDFETIRLLTDGQLDGSFGAAGKSDAPFGSSSSDIGSAIAQRPDGRIVLAGSSNAFDPNYDFAVVQLLNPAGTFDHTFGGGGGKSYGDFGSGSTGDRATAIALQADGKILVAGDKSVGGGYDMAVARLLDPSGSFDPSFASGGVATIDIGNFDIATGVAVQPDGKIVLSGNGGNKFTIVRLLANGQLDDSFAGDGKAAVDFGAAGGATSLVLQPDGKIVAAGGSGGDVAVARLQPNGSLDTTFGNGGKTTVDFGGTEAARGVALAPDGSIVAAGTSNPPGTDDGGDIVVTRLQGDPGGTVKKAKCGGRKATIIGTNGRDKLKGTRKRDVIVALGGKDTVRGLGGNDLVCGGAGKDKLVGGTGKDKLLGQGGKDLLKGGAGRDKLIGGAGKDKLVGGPGKDSEKRQAF